MAKLYKMTLYVCDLEGDMSLQEIKTRIEERALQSVACNCICNFVDEKVGPEIEWYDEIPLNFYNCPTSEWEEYFK